MDESGVMRAYPFVTGLTAHCVWEHDVRSSAKQYLENQTPEYYEYLAEIHGDAIESNNSSLAALSLRCTVLQGYETLFAMLGALVQAPHTPHAWVHRYSTPDLKWLVKSISNRDMVPSRLKTTPSTWADISAIIHASYAGNSLSRDEVISGYGSLWTRMAAEFIEPSYAYELNSMKHALRVRSQGFGLAIGPVGGEPQSLGPVITGRNIMKWKAFRARRVTSLCDSICATGVRRI